MGLLVEVVEKCNGLPARHCLETTLKDSENYSRYKIKTMKIKNKNVSASF